MAEVRDGYKMTELGEIPSEWKVVNLGDLANIHRGASPRPIKDPKWFSNHSTHGWVRISDVTKSKKYLFETEQYLSEEGIQKSRTVKPGDLIMSICGTIGRPIILQMNACIHDGFVAFENLNTCEVDTEFLRYYLTVLTDYFKSQGQPGTQVNLNTAIVEKAQIALPLIKEQQKIAEILFSVDTQIEQTEQLIEKTKEMKKGLMQQLLTRGIGHTEFKQSEIGEIPFIWECLTFEKIMLPKGEGIRRGPFGGALKKEIFVSEGYAVYEQQHVIYNQMHNFRYFITAEKYEELKAFEILSNDILISCSGTVGKVSVVPEDCTPGVMNQALLRLRAGNDVDIYFLYYLLSSEFVQHKLLDMTHGSTLKNIVSISEIKNILLAVPPLEEQQKIASILSTVDAEIDSYEQEKAKYEELKKGLMQQLLTGKIRVKVDA